MGARPGYSGILDSSYGNRTVAVQSGRYATTEASLEGAVAILLWQLPGECLGEMLLGLLRSRFGTADMIEWFQCELRQRRRRHGESIQSVYNDVCRLVALSYPGETGELSRLVARDAFLDCLGNAEMRVRVLERGATLIDEAYTIAARHETYAAAAGAIATSSSNVGRTPSYDVRDIAAATDHHRLSALGRAVSSLKNELHSWRFQTGQSNFQPTAGSALQELAPRRERLCYQCHQSNYLRRNCPQRATAAPCQLQREILPCQLSTATSGSLHESAQQMHCCLSRSSNRVVIANLALFLLIVSSIQGHLMLLPSQYCFQEILPSDFTLKTVSGESLSVAGATKAKICMGNALRHVEFVVSVDKVLLSISFLAVIGAIWNFKEASIEIGVSHFNFVIASRIIVSDVFILRVIFVSNCKQWPLYLFI
jgi:hypothetical protein